MGVDFIRKAAPSFRKGVDRTRIRLGTPTLFMQQPEVRPHSYAVRLGERKSAVCGEKLGIRLEGEVVVALRGIEAIASFSCPTPELKAALQASHGEAFAEVRTVHSIAGVMEVTIC
jgi:hypothetical protein